MTRRLVAGSIPGYGVDVRISRPGFDAMTADPNDLMQISFAASRFGMAKFGVAGLLSPGGSAAVGPYADAVPPLVGIYRGGQMFIDDYVRYSDQFQFIDGTPYTLEVTSTSLVVRQSLRGNAIPAGTQLMFVTFET